MIKKTTTTIVPADVLADYNWQLFDVTNTNPEDIFTNATCSWPATGRVS